MSLVDDDGVVLAEVAIVMHRVQQDAVGHDLDLGFGTGSVGESNLITDLGTNLDLEFFGYALGDRAGGDSARLGVGDAGAPKLETHFGQLRCLARTGCASDNDHLIVTNRGKNFILALTYRQVGRVGDQSRIHSLLMLVCGQAWADGCD